MASGSRKKVGFADLFAGRGSYEAPDGSIQKSTPLLVCETVAGNEQFREKVHLWFNEANSGNFESLKNSIEQTPGIALFKYKPRIDNKVVTPDWAVKLRKLSVPTLLFLDPCGYKGLSLDLIAAALSGFGNDCIFFFNYSRINMKLDLEIMNDSIDQFFKAERAKLLRAEIKNRNPAEREEIILSAVRDAIEEVGAISLPFKFKSDNGRTSHHLIYASKNKRASGMMKHILRSVSSTINEGVGSHEHDPRSKSATASLFAGLYEVEDRLLNAFANRELSFGSLLDEESKTKFTDSNYRDALLSLEAQGKVVAEPNTEARPFQAGGKKRTLSKNVLLKFIGKPTNG
jgi:three-Cys-motif partner protein